MASNAKLLKNLLKKRKYIYEINVKMNVGISFSLASAATWNKILTYYLGQLIKAAAFRRSRHQLFGRNQETLLIALSPFQNRQRQQQQQQKKA